MIGIILFIYQIKYMGDMGWAKMFYSMLEKKGLDKVLHES